MRAYLRKKHGESHLRSDNSATLVANCWTTTPKARIVLDACIDDHRASFHMSADETLALIRELQNALDLHNSVMS